MQIVEQKAKYIAQKYDTLGIAEIIEQAGRTCYRSEGKTQIGEDGRSLTAQTFADKLLKQYKHLSVAEHATIYLQVADRSLYKKYKKNPFSVAKEINWGSYERYYITTNYRVILENKWEADLQYMGNPTIYHELRHTFRLFTNRGISAEVCRQRQLSFSERSTRYVPYKNGLPICNPILEPFDIITNGQFNVDINMLTKLYNGTANFSVEQLLTIANSVCEKVYQELGKLNTEPQIARDGLPLDLQTEIVVTGHEHLWYEFLDKRLKGTTGKPHPTMQKLSQLILDEAHKNNLLKEYTN